MPDETITSPEPEANDPQEPGFYLDSLGNECVRGLPAPDLHHSVAIESEFDDAHDKNLDAVRWAKAKLNVRGHALAANQKWDLEAVDAATTFGRLYSVPQRDIGYLTKSLLEALERNV